MCIELSEEEQLLPGGDPSPAVVLFWHPDDPRSGAMRTRFAQMPWPRGYRVLTVRMGDRNRRLQDWFSLDGRSGVAILADGALLAIEDSCDEGACRRLIEMAEACLVTFQQDL